MAIYTLWQKQHLAIRADLEKSFPATINLGLFTLSSAKVRALMLDKHSEIAKKLMDMVARVTIDYTNFAIDEYEQILGRLRQDPKDIEQIDDLKGYMITAPNLVLNLNLQVSPIYIISLANFNFSYTIILNSSRTVSATSTRWSP